MNYKKLNVEKKKKKFNIYNKYINSIFPALLSIVQFWECFPI